MAAPLSLTLAQLNPVVGDLAYNRDKILAAWKESKADLVVFPELVVCGYPPEDLVLKPLFLKKVEEIIAEICEASKKFKAAAVVTMPWVIDGKKYNALHVIEGGKILYTQAKHLLPNYGVFDEQRVFAAGPLPKPFTFRGHKLGLLICEDLWFPDVASHLKQHGAEILISPNGSPYEVTKDETRVDIVRARAKETGLPIVYVNQVGGQDELVFDGASFIVDQNGAVIFQAKEFAEGIYDVVLDGSALNMAPHAPPEEELYGALVLGLKDYIAKNNFPGVLLGLSGGIDSGISAVIAADALGAENVHCVMMPSRFTSQDSLDDAAALAKNLGCPYEIISIEKPMAAFEHIIPKLSGVAHENSQSRIRGLILMALSNASGKMVLSTGNKSEMAVGYATLYGDMNGGYNVLKDLYKMQVYALSKWRNAQDNVIPNRILTKVPTAELRENQTDQDSLPPYEVLDDILECLIEHEMAPAEIAKRGHDIATVNKVWKMLDRAEYKRRQAPPGVKITSRAFGRDRRYPITNGFVKHIEK
jgi:NAD+ synthase